MSSPGETPPEVLDPDDPKIKREILKLIVQYLEENGYRHCAAILRNEARFQTTDDTAGQTIDLASIRSIVTSKNWEQLDALQIDKNLPPRLVYSLYRYRFIDLLLSSDATSALPFLSSRLRPFRAFEDQPGDFDQLCFMLVDAASPSRTGALPDREASLQRTLAAIDAQISLITAPSNDSSIPAGRLAHLAQQAAAYQLTKFPLGTIKSIMKDFTPAAIPSPSDKTLSGGHKGNIKAVVFVPRSNYLISGGSDSNICVWDVMKGTSIAKLKGHKSRIWSIAATDKFAATASGDGTIKLWEFDTFQNLSTLSGHSQDVYTVDVNKTGTQILSGGFDRVTHLWDVEAGVLVNSMKNHKGAVTSVCFDTSGNMAVTGGKDLQICITDLRSGICLRNLTPVLGEVASVCADRCFTRILAATKNSTNRIWDLRMAGTSVLFKGHQNFSKSFVRARFGVTERTVISGSDDGKVYCWDADSGVLVSQMEGHRDGVFDVVCSSDLQMFASCGGNDVVRIWGQTQMK